MGVAKRTGKGNGVGKVIKGKVRCLPKVLILYLVCSPGSGPGTSIIHVDHIFLTQKGDS